MERSFEKTLDLSKVRKYRHEKHCDYVLGHRDKSSREQAFHNYGLFLVDCVQVFQRFKGSIIVEEIPNREEIIEHLDSLILEYADSYRKLDAKQEKRHLPSKWSLPC